MNDEKLGCVARLGNLKNILVAAQKDVASGGLLRFVRMGRVIQRRGIKVVFAFDTIESTTFPTTEFEIISIVDSFARDWDCVIVPGAGFSDEFISQLNRFHAPNFGIRVQAVLNDKTHKKKFLAVNRSFLPHSVVFNTRQWEPGSFTEFKGHRFRIIEGAVDSVSFSFSDSRESSKNTTFVVGLQSKYLKDIDYLVDSLPDNISFQVIRQEASDASSLTKAQKKLVDANRLTFLGYLPEAQLLSFYRSCDCVLHLEKFAGWANLVAEAMACGVPVVCTPAGTQAFAEDGVTALVVDHRDWAAIAAALRAVQDDPMAARQRALKARDRIAAFSWEDYSEEFLKAVCDDGFRHYLYAPDWGMFGKWPKKARLNEAEFIAEYAKGSDILDLGCAEGYVSKYLVDRGARSVHGFDLDSGRIEKAKVLLGGQVESVFRVENLVPWHQFISLNRDVLRASYDLVLFLGVYHHLASDVRISVLNEVLKLTKEVFAIKTPHSFFTDDNLGGIITKAGFRCVRDGSIEKDFNSPMWLYIKEDGLN